MKFQVMTTQRALRYGSGRSSFEKPNRWLSSPSAASPHPPHRWLRAREGSSEHMLLRCHARFRVWPLRSVGKRGAGSAPRKVNIWRLASAPPVVLPDRRGPRGGLCRCGGAAKRARASDDNFQPRFRHATGPAPPPSLIPGAHQVPVRAMPEIMEAAERGWIKNFVFFIRVLGAETDEGASSLARRTPSNHRDDHRGLINSLPKPRKRQRQVTEHLMRGLLMALFAFDFPGHAGRGRAPVRSPKTTAKTTTKTV